ncbi:putative 3-ketodihydrosphingosine reductase [Apostichopus japonicus]|uniref:3-dehydrosphinganine reductase n=1 Tax=Stichopus japonicus TaxID=307972 RepID=A0A2G8JTY7_STIJA|nr:putative 3-ketodihydrosphingosine reductase [Apostichopus japonicus]
MEASVFLIVAISLFFAIVVLIYILSPLISPSVLKLDRSHVIITGGSSGIGKAVAAEVLKLGASVTILGRDQGRLKQAKHDLEKYIRDQSHQRILCISVDVSKDYSTVEKAISESVTTLGPCDVLVNSAGGSYSGTFEATPVDEFKRLIDVNLLGTVYATKACLPYMMKQNKGRIVLISSQAGQLGLFGYTAYCSSKFALRGFAEALQMEVKPYNVYITINYPPDTDTPLLHSEDETKPMETKLISETSGLFQPEDVAKTIKNDLQKGVFLSSVGMDGWILAILTSGAAPITSLMQAVQEFLLMGLFRVVSLFYSSSFDRLIKKCKAEREARKEQH